MTSIQQLTLIGLGIIIVMLGLYLFGIKPIFDSHSTLTSQINKEKNLSKYLKSANATIGGQKVYPVLTNSKALALIQSTLGVVQNITRTDERVTSTIKQQNFDNLKNGLYALKNKYGIVVVNAQITKVANGLVDATLVFTHP